MTTELSIHELEDELIAELPTREALSTVTANTWIWASNSATAFNIFTGKATATAVAVQDIQVEPTIVSIG